MVRTNHQQLLALSLGLLITVSGTLAQAQGPVIESGSPSPSAHNSRSQEKDEVTGGSTASAPADAGPPPIPFPGAALPAESDEPLLLPPPQADGNRTQDPVFQAPSTAAGGVSPFMNPVVGHAPLRTDYQALWLAPEPVAGQPTKLGYVQQDFSLSFPIWQCATTDEWLASVNLRNLIFQTHAILPDTRQPFPDNLWNIRFGTTYRHLFENGWIGGGSVTVGSASDKPFHSIDEMTAGVSAFLRIPQGEHNAWLFSLSYSPTSELPFPIPGAAFVWQPSEYFRANIGVPFQVMWRPIDDLTLDLSYMLLTTFHARMTYWLCRPVRVYLAYASENEGYLLADRISLNDRFYHADQRLTGGIQVNIGPKTVLDFSSGYIFDHHFFEGKNITSGTGFNRVDVDNAPYVALQLRFRW